MWAESTTAAGCCAEVNESPAIRNGVRSQVVMRRSLEGVFDGGLRSARSPYAKKRVGPVVQNTNRKHRSERRGSLPAHGAPQQQPRAPKWSVWPDEDSKRTPPT